MVAAYAVAIFAALFSGCCALTIINTVRHFDSPEPAEKSKEQPVTV